MHPGKSVSARSAGTAVESGQDLERSSSDERHEGWRVLHRFAPWSPWATSCRGSPVRRRWDTRSPPWSSQASWNGCSVFSGHLDFLPGPSLRLAGPVEAAGILDLAPRSPASAQPRRKTRPRRFRDQSLLWLAPRPPRPSAEVPQERCGPHWIPGSCFGRLPPELAGPCWKTQGAWRRNFAEVASRWSCAVGPRSAAASSWW